MKRYDLAIIGGGASGLFAACAFARLAPGSSVVVLEAADRVGKKLLKTGNGQGNITCAVLDPCRYHGADPDFCRPALAAFDHLAAREAFARMGLLTVVEDERVFPLSKQAGSILDVLRLELEAVGAELRTDCPVREVRKRQDFEVQTPAETLLARNVLLATGGKSSPTTKAFAEGYDVARSLGHRVTPLYPSLVQLRADMADCQVLRGVKNDVRLTLADHSGVLFAQTGEILFCEDGISGKIVFAASSYAAGREGPLSADIDFLPDFSAEELLTLLRERKTGLPHLAPDRLLTGIAKSQVARAVLARAKLPAVRQIEALSDPELQRVGALLKGFSLRVTGTRPFDSAQVTRGGVRTADVDPLTMMSKRTPGLYFAGEILDIDGDCGGFNLQWCWSSAMVAARATAARLDEGRTEDNPAHPSARGTRS